MSWARRSLLITHDMGVVAQIADRVAVMYAGKIAELGTVNDIFEAPLHPYSQGLIGSIPRESGHRVEGLPGEAPSPWNYPSRLSFSSALPQSLRAFAASRCQRSAGSGASERWAVLPLVRYRGRR